jgi:hypothetical protein
MLFSLRALHLPLSGFQAFFFLALTGFGLQPFLLSSFSVAEKRGFGWC